MNIARYMLFIIYDFSHKRRNPLEVGAFFILLILGCQRI